MTQLSTNKHLITILDACNLSSPSLSRSLSLLWFVRVFGVCVRRRWFDTCGNLPGRCKFEPKDKGVQQPDGAIPAAAKWRNDRKSPRLASRTACSPRDPPLSLDRRTLNSSIFSCMHLQWKAATYALPDCNCNYYKKVDAHINGSLCLCACSERGQ